jgi:hypothetical protein
MNAVSVQIVIAAVGVVVSICCSMFVAGSRWGRIEGDMRSMSDRLAKIEGMFSLRLRDPDDNDRARR